MPSGSLFCLVSPLVPEQQEQQQPEKVPDGHGHGKIKSPCKIDPTIPRCYSWFDLTNKIIAILQQLEEWNEE